MEPSLGYFAALLVKPILTGAGNAKDRIVQGRDTGRGLLFGRRARRRSSRPDVPLHRRGAGQAHATPAVDNTSKDVARAANNMPEVPKGFKVSIFADKLTNARWMAVAPNGDVFLAEPGSADGEGKVTLLRDSKAGGKADQRFTFVSGMNQPHGLALHGGYLYIGATDAIWRVPYKDGQTTAAARPERVTRAADLRPKGNHWTRDIAFGPDGALYLAFGSRDNVSDFKPGAQVFKVDAQGNMAQFASGIRNPVGIAFYPGSNTLYVSVNERDGLGDDLPPDYFTSVRPGGFYGYPYSYIGKNPIPTGRQGARRPDRQGDRARCAVPCPFGADGSCLLHGDQFPGGVQERRLRVAARFLECRPPDRLQGGAGAFRERQARRQLREFRHRLLAGDRSGGPAGQDLGPPRWAGGGQGRQPAHRRRCRQCGLAGALRKVGELAPDRGKVWFGTHPRKDGGTEWNRTAGLLIANGDAVKQKVRWTFCSPNAQQTRKNLESRGQ